MLCEINIFNDEIMITFKLYIWEKTKTMIKNFKTEGARWILQDSLHWPQNQL